VKFSGDKLPAIYNAIETTNNGQKLVLEVAVRALIGPSLRPSIKS
jgi:F0F1-type ATP synthase beta subunit